MLNQQISTHICLARWQTMRPWTVPWYSPMKATLVPQEPQAPLRLMPLPTLHCHPSRLHSHAHNHPQHKHPPVPCRHSSIRDLYSHCDEAHPKDLDQPGASPGIRCLPIKSRPRPRIHARGSSTLFTQISRSHRYSISDDDHLPWCAQTVRTRIRTRCILVCRHQAPARRIRRRGLHCKQ